MDLFTSTTSLTPAGTAIVTSTLGGTGPDITSSDLSGNVTIDGKTELITPYSTSSLSLFSTICSGTLSECSVSEITRASYVSSQNFVSLEPAYAIPDPPQEASTIFMKRSMIEATPSITTTLAKRTDQPQSLSCAGCVSKVVSAPVSVTSTSSDDMDDAQELKRAIAGRLTYQFFKKRQLAIRINSLGPKGKSCSLQTPVKNYVMEPAYPGGQIFFRSDLANQLEGNSAMVPRWYSTTVQNHVPSITSIEAGTYNKAKDKDTPTMDHSYEMHWLHEFFANIIDPKGSLPQKADCDDFNHYMFDDTKGTKTQNRLKAVFDALPSDDNVKDFVGMSRSLNSGAKGIVANAVGKGGLDTVCRNQFGPEKKVKQGQKFDEASGVVAGKITLLRNLAMGCAMLNDQKNIENMMRTNNRIWKALKAVDNYARCEFNDPLVKRNKWSFAQKYKTYMQDLVNDKSIGMNPLSRYYAARLIAAINADLTVLENFRLSNAQKDQLREKQNEYNALRNLGDPNDANVWAYGVRVQWDWSRNLQTRDLEGDLGYLEEREDSDSCEREPDTETDTHTGTGTGTDVGNGIDTGTGTGAGSTPPATQYDPYCVLYEGHDQDINSAQCQCGDSSIYSAMSSDDLCGYTSPVPSSLLITSTPTPLANEPSPSRSPQTSPALPLRPSPSALTASMPVLPLSCTGATAMETGNEYEPVDPACGGSDGNAHSDIFTCGLNSGLFELLAPVGTPRSNGLADNDESGWASCGGGVCFCMNGNLYCNEDATTCLPISAGFLEHVDDGPDADATEWFQSSANNGQCSCDG